MKSLCLPSILLLTVLSAIPAFAECKYGWCKGGCDQKRCMKVKVLSKNHPVIKVRLSNNRGIGDSEYNCKTYEYRFIRNDGSLGEQSQAKTGSPGKKAIDVACSIY